MFSKLLALVLLIVSCQSASKRETAGETSKRGISQEEALSRAQKIENVEYLLEFDVRDENFFSGVTVIKFNFKGGDVWLDFDGGEIRDFKINKVAKTPVLKGRRIFLDGSLLKIGGNSVEVSYKQKYSTNGAGYYQFIDPEDKSRYTYTQFEPFDANHLFPCFDQPDLKATYHMTVVAPKDWKVITAAPVHKKIVLKTGVQWEFAKSQKFSTYLVSLIAGPYAEWHDEYVSGSRRVPLGLYIRKTLAKYSRAKEIFSVTKKGMKYFEDYFGYPYPFAKYDQVMAPNYNWGGMENVAAVTYTENFAVRGQITRADRERLANTFLHELAHMWFGDLVTMRWWNDLWLNESFATYMSFKAQSEALGLKETWRSFFQLKMGGYRQDLSVITHPIEVEIPTTDDAFANFDAITYNKGASVLKQLAYLIGEKAYKDGLKYYFATHAFKNTARADFIDAMERSSKRDLSKWTELWLQKAGINHFQPIIKCEGQSLTDFKVVQTVRNGENVFRPQKWQVALYGQNNKKVELAERVDVEVDGAEASVLPSSRKCPVLVQLNYGDYGYFSHGFDKSTLANLPNMLSRVGDELERMMFWSALWDQVRDGGVSIFDYAELVLINLEPESSEKVLEQVLGTVIEGGAGRPTVQYFLTRSEAFADKAKQFNITLEQILLRKLQGARPGSDIQKRLFYWYLAGTQSQKKNSVLVEIAKGHSRFPGLKVDPEMKWSALKELASYGYPEAERMADVQLNMDPSDWGRKSRLSVSTLVPSDSAKLKGLKFLKDDHQLADQRVVMRSLFSFNQDEWLRKYADQVLELAIEMKDKRDDYYMETYVGSLLPALCDEIFYDRLQHFRASTEFSPAADKEIKYILDEDARCLRLKKLWLSQIPSRVEGAPSR